MLSNAIHFTHCDKCETKFSKIYCLFVGFIIFNLNYYVEKEVNAFTAFTVVNELKKKYTSRAVKCIWEIFVKIKRNSSLKSPHKRFSHSNYYKNSVKMTTDL